MAKLGRRARTPALFKGGIEAEFTPCSASRPGVAGGVDGDTTYTPGGPAKVKVEHRAAAYAVGYLPVTPNLDLLGEMKLQHDQVRHQQSSRAQFDSSHELELRRGHRVQTGQQNSIQAGGPSPNTPRAIWSNTVSVGYVALPERAVSRPKRRRVLRRTRRFPRLGLGVIDRKGRLRKRDPARP
ncbi:autotransporter [Caulobacter segnis]